MRTAFLIVLFIGAALIGTASAFIGCGDDIPPRNDGGDAG